MKKRITTVRRCILLIIGYSQLLSCQFKAENEFVLSDQSGRAPIIYVDKQSADLIKWAADDLASDLEMLGSRKVTIKYTEKFEPGGQGIYIGQFGDNLVQTLPVDYSQLLRGQWEKFIIKAHQNNLFIVGSDIRGTVYGIFDVAERLGISPWKWWADVEPLEKERIILDLPEDGIEASPSVQYRGIFLNDEDWGLQPWAAKTFEPETQDIGPKTYEKIFQLLLRLKANTIWPAMHPSTRAFFSIDGNKEMAERYHIFVGTSHAEPMLRNNVGEWNKETYGEYNYMTNSTTIKEYWEKRVSEIDKNNYIFTMGMRGIHDSGMEGDATVEERVDLLEQIISDQREMLKNNLNRPLEHIPQVFIPYKEVLYLYEKGMKVPEDITLIWTDDNYGYIRRLSNKDEQKRKGGSGVYYHLSYWGRPHDYLWLSSTQPGLIWYEMSRAYQNGAQKIWIANVGDIKPAEYTTEFFLDLAWDVNCITHSSINEHLSGWCAREFGTEIAGELTDLMNEYYRLAFLRKPEYMGWSRTEPITPTKPTDFALVNENELQRRIDAYRELYEKAEKLKAQVAEKRKDAYFQLVEYPVKGAALMNFKFLYAQKAYLSRGEDEELRFSVLAQDAYEEIRALTKKYNNDISDGKWQNIMHMSPRNLPAYQMPEYHLSDSLPDREKMKEPDLLKQKPIFIQASDFKNSESTSNFKWGTIEALGYSNASTTLLPLENHLFTENLPFLEYSFDIDTEGEYEIEVRYLPTHSNHFDHKIGIQVNAEPVKTYSLNTKGRSEEWKQNVLRNYQSVRLPFAFTSKGTQSLKILVNQTGIVIDQISVTPKGYSTYYEIVK